ncbi:nucleoside recognition domain-containing protein [Paenibacillus sp. JTLBN-2024]
MLGAGALALVAAIVSSPSPAFQASLQGLKLWWQIVFPALLPFLVLSEILTAYGFIHALGTWLEPLMKRLFKLPGVGGWVLAMGMTTGFPGGAQAAKQLYDQGDLNGPDAGKLAALSHFCNPMLILVVIATGLMHEPAAGYVVLAVHWLAGLLAYLLIGRRGAGKDAASQAAEKPDEGKNKPSMLRRSLHAAKAAHAKDGRGFGRLLGDSVTNAVQTLMMVGGYIIIFAVVIQIAGRFLLPDFHPIGCPERSRFISARTMRARPLSPPNGCSGPSYPPCLASAASAPCCSRCRC